MEQLWIYRPAFTRGCDQLSAEDVEAMRKIANVGIHVEQIIGAGCQRFQTLSVVLWIMYVKELCHLIELFVIQVHALLIIMITVLEFNLCACTCKNV